VPVWVRFPNLPLCCWSPVCLSKIASVIGKPIQCDHMTSTLSRLSYARVLIELDLREDLPASVTVPLPSGPVLHQKVVYESLPKFCNFCNSIGHTRLLCSKAASSSKEGGVASDPHASKVGVFSRLGPHIHQVQDSTTDLPEQSRSSAPAPLLATSNSPAVDPQPVEPCVASEEGWTMVESRRKSHNRVKSPLKGTAVEAVSGNTPSPALLPTCTDFIVPPPSFGIANANTSTAHLPPACVEVVSPVGAEVGLVVASPRLRPPQLGDGILAPSPFARPLLGTSVNTTMQRHSKRTTPGSRRVIPSPASP